MTNPEYKEKTEKYRERQMLSPELEDKIKNRIAQHDKYPDPVFCPNQSCGVPVNIVNESDKIILKCSMCGFERIIEKV